MMITKQQLEALIVVLQRAPVTQPEAVLISEIVNTLSAALPPAPEPEPDAVRS